MDQNMMMFLLLYLLLQRQSGQTGTGTGTSALGSSNVLLPTVVGFSNAAPAVRGIATYTTVKQIDDERAQLATEKTELDAQVHELEEQMKALELKLDECDKRWADTASEVFNFCTKNGFTPDKLQEYPLLSELYKLGTPNI